MPLNPLDIIAKGMKINPQITRLLFGVVVLVACVALAGQLVKDPTTAIIGGLLVVVATVILIVVSAITASQISSVAVWFSRAVSVLFILVCLTLFSAWAFEFPRGLPCLINPWSVCVHVPILPSNTGAGPVCLKPDEQLPVGSCGETDGNYVVINVRSDDPDHGLNVHASPAINGLIVGILKPNSTDLKVGSCDSGWCEVECKAVKGWSRDRYLGLRTSVLYNVTGISQAAIGLAARNGPDQICSAIASIPYNGRDVIIHSCQYGQDGSSRWCLITYNNRSGWVPIENLSRQN
jgi:SH3-like domain-containing protein